jgi:hypothetical protein
MRLAIAADANPPENRAGERSDKGNRQLSGQVRLSAVAEVTPGDLREAVLGHPSVLSCGTPQRPEGGSWN